MHEWLTYEFDDLAADHATLMLCWEKLAVPIKITVDTNAVVLNNARNVYLRGIPGFSPDGWNNAATYCLMNKVNLDEGLAWAKRSVAMGPSFKNLWTEGGLLEALGKKDEAKAAQDKALALAVEADLNAAGYQYLQSGRLDDALAMFRRNVEAHPESWNVYDSLAEACAAKGDKKTAMEMYGKALSMAPDDAQKTRIQKVMSDLGG
jgi:tetratricopeptide (TPR) repeat protein